MIVSDGALVLKLVLWSKQNILQNINGKGISVHGNYLQKWYVFQTSLAKLS